MNVEIRTFITFSGPVVELEPLLSDIASAVVAHGYGVTSDELSSLVVARESEIIAYEKPEDFVRSVAENTFALIIPESEETDEDSSSGD